MQPYPSEFSNRFTEYMSWWQAALLGLLQGLTEFLPVSSSGHLVLAQHFLGLSESVGHVTFDVFLHFGTVLSILTVYRREVGSLIGTTLTSIAKPASVAESYRSKDEFRMAIFILITMVPTGLVYVLFGDYLEARFSDPRFASGMLILTGILLLLTLLRKNPDGSISPLKAVLIGVAQSAAMTPGISRSGSTICTALYLNVEPKKAADFSFLMLLPVVLGATLLKGIDLVQGSQFDIGWGPVLVGTVVAYVSGVAAIKILLDVIRRGRLSYFAYYCLAVGALGLLFI